MSRDKRLKHRMEQEAAKARNTGGSFLVGRGGNSAGVHKDRTRPSRVNDRVSFRRSLQLD